MMAQTGTTPTQIQTSSLSQRDWTSFASSAAGIVITAVICAAVAIAGTALV